MQRKYCLVDRLSSWKIFGSEPTFNIVGNSTRHARTRIHTAPLYGVDPQYHYIYCADGTLYLLDYSTRDDINAWTYLTKMIPLMPIPLIQHPWVTFDHRDPVYVTQRSVDLFEVMPDEIWCNVMRWVPAGDRAAMFLTCKSFNRAATTVFMPMAAAIKNLVRWSITGDHLDSISFLTRILGSQNVNAVIEHLFGQKEPVSNPTLTIDAEYPSLCALSGHALSRVVKSTQLTKANLRRMLSTTRIVDLLSRDVFAKALWDMRTLPGVARDIGCLLAESRSLDATLTTLANENHTLYNIWCNVAPVRERVIVASIKFDERIALTRLCIDRGHAILYGEKIYDVIVAHKRFTTLIYMLELHAIPRHLVAKYAFWVCRFPREAIHVVPAIRENYPEEFINIRRGLMAEVADRAKKQIEEPRKIRHTQLLSVLAP